MPDPQGRSREKLRHAFLRGPGEIRDRRPGTSPARVPSGREARSGSPGPPSASPRTSRDSGTRLPDRGANVLRVRFAPCCRTISHMRDALVREIVSYTPEDAAEGYGRDAVLDLLTLKDFASRTHFKPGHITASGFIVDAGGARVLLHHHRRLNRWLQMGGHLEPGETPTAAALREAREESGLPDLFFLRDEIFDLALHEIPALRAEHDHRQVDLRYVRRQTQTAR